MKRAVAWLEPHLEAAKSTARSQGRIVLATVKGDVHDIGKNIVGVVLGCNGYEIIDLGVMVPADRILDTAEERGADAIGLSGLITPSLDEMAAVAAEMERRGFSLPLLIGGATTSKQHTAVRIAPRYGQSVVHVQDASRAVGAVAKLLDADRRAEFDVQNRADQQRLRDVHAGRQEKPLLSLSEARSKRPGIAFRGEAIAKPGFCGRRQVDGVALADIAAYIDWTFFFSAWDLKGRFPQILDNPKYGEAARELYANGRHLLHEIVSQQLLQARGVYGFWPANSDGDDIVVWQDASRSRELLRLPMLRQQAPSPSGVGNRCLADFLAPADSGLEDWIGAFAVTTGLGADALARRYEDAGDDYHAIMVKALADRLAEAYAELLHARARREWGEATEAELSLEDLIGERYRGIRPALGYPACPDHSEKRELFDLLAAREIGMDLTESCAMTPAASVSGLYFAHPEARYFNVGRIGRDQLEDYARRRGMEIAQAERWLAPILGYSRGEG